MSTPIIKPLAFCVLALALACSGVAKGEDHQRRPECIMHQRMQEPICTHSFLTLAAGAARVNGQLVSISGHLVKLQGVFLLFQDPVPYRYSGGIGGLRIRVDEQARSLLENLLPSDESSTILLGRQACQPVAFTGRYRTAYEDEPWSMGTLEALEELPSTPRYPGGIPVSINQVEDGDLKRMCEGAR